MPGHVDLHLHSHLSFAFAAATVCHCKLEGLSGPPLQRATRWSAIHPGQPPYFFPVEGHGCIRMNSRRTAVDLWIRLNACWGSRLTAMMQHAIKFVRAFMGRLYIGGDYLVAFLELRGWNTGYIRWSVFIETSRHLTSPGLGIVGSSTGGFSRFNISTLPFGNDIFDLRGLGFFLDFVAMGRFYFLAGAGAIGTTGATTCGPGFGSVGFGSVAAFKSACAFSSLRRRPVRTSSMSSGTR